jgi:hypothetical protein
MIGKNVMEEEIKDGYDSDSGCLILPRGQFL